MLKRVNKIDSKTALKNSKIPLSSISQIPELQLNPLLGRLLETAKEDIEDDEINFTMFMKILKVLSPETEPATKKKLLFRMIDVTGDGIITRREFVLFFVNVYWSRSHFNEEENNIVSRKFSIGESQINEIYHNIENILSGVGDISAQADQDIGRTKPKMEKDNRNPNDELLRGVKGQINADQQLKFEDFDKLVTDEDAFQYLTINFY